MNVSLSLKELTSAIMDRTSTRARKLAIVTLVLLSGGQGLANSGWPQFRGPNGQGISTQAPPPAHFGPASNLLWKTELPAGHSSPVLAGGRVFLTGLHTGRLHTIALDQATGRIIWQRTAPAEAIEKVHSFASPATPTPLVDEKRVLVYFGSFGLICYNHDGEQLWARQLPTPKSTYGTASSPIRVDDKAVIVLDSNDKASKALAVRLADGTTVWEADRPLSASGWATPAVWEHDGTSEVVVLGARRLISYDSKSGKELWWIDGYPPETISVPVTGDGFLFVSAAGLAGPPNEGFETMSWHDMLPLDKDGNGTIHKSEIPADFKFTLRPELPPDNPGRFMPRQFRSMFDSLDGNRDGELTEPEFMELVKQWRSRAAPALRAIRPGGNGDVTKTHVAWQLRKGIPEIPSPLFHQGRIYMVRDGGFMTAASAATGKLLFEERMGVPGAYCSSPVVARDRIYVASHSGTVLCVDGAGEQLNVLARNELKEKIWATPALGKGAIYVRTEKHLYAFAEAK